jgi:hypothetical protein
MNGKTAVRLFFILPLFLFLFSSTAESQVLKVAAGNTLIGTANGALLGLSYMGLANDANLAPVRFGIGAGTIYGMGVGFSDALEYDRNGFYSIEGLFNTTEYTTQIVLYDTFYGGVTGAVLGMAVGLMTNQHVGEFIRYGASTGSFLGFGFGLFDAFYLSRQQNFAFDEPVSSLNHQHVEGLLVLQGLPANAQIGLISTIILPSQKYYQYDFSRKQILSPEVGLRLIHVKLPL